MILGRIIGKATTSKFQFNVTSAKARKYQFVQVNHAEYGFVLCQVLELTRTSEGMTASCTVLGYKAEDGRLTGMRTPFQIGSEILEAEDDFIKQIIQLDSNSAYFGKLEGKDLKVHIDLQKLLTRHVAVLAKSGAGKSYAVGVLLEEIIEQGVPLLIIDPHGEYSTMKNPSEDKTEDLATWGIEAKGYLHTIQEFGDPQINLSFKPIKLSEKMSSFELLKLLPLNLSNTQESILFSVVKDIPEYELNFDNILIGLSDIQNANIWPVIDTIKHLRDLGIFSATPTPLQDLIKPGRATILNLKGMDPEVQKMITAKLLADLFQARKRNQIPPFFCVVEEAHNFVPEKGFGKAQSSEVIRLISSEGRKFGLGLCVVSQRPALLQKTVLAQCSTQIVMKITNPNDLRSITASAEGVGSETQDEIQNLPIGSALVCGVVDRPLVVRVRRRRSKHGGEAVNVLAQNKSEPNNFDSEEPEESNFKEKLEQHQEKQLTSVIPPKLSIRDIKLISDQEISKITTYLIPAYFTNVKLDGSEFHVLIDAIKGMILIDPDTDKKIPPNEISRDASFLRIPEYQQVNFDQRISNRLTESQIRESLEPYCHVLEMQETNIVFHKVEYV
tara:strand:+ start:8472 stop:10313 length:1842 start_codon:yes stop_codon:yes gene_type:complete